MTAPWDKQPRRLDSPIKQYPDIIPKVGVQIKIRHDGGVVWINVDGICVMRLFPSSPGSMPLTIEDERTEK